MASQEPTPAQDSLVARLLRPDMAAEFFLPAEASILKPAKDDAPARYELRPQFKDRIKRERHGVRLQAHDPKIEIPTQNVRLDLSRTIESLIILRGEQQYNDFTLGSAVLTAQTDADTQRVLFALEGGSASDQVCARRSHRAIMDAVHASGHRLKVTVPDFDAKSGLTGLRDWCNTIELEKRRKPPLWPLLLLLPLLFLFLYWPRKPIEIFGTQVETANIIVLFDVSGSMTSVSEEVRDESVRILSAMIAKNTTYYVNYIAFADTDEPLFGQLTKIDTKIRDTIMAWLAHGVYSAGKGNEYHAGFKTAFAEALDSGQPTTIILLTDGQIPLVEKITPGKTQEQQLGSILSPFPENLAARTKAAALKRQIIIKVPKIYNERPDITPKMKALVEAFNGADNK